MLENFEMINVRTNFYGKGSLNNIGNAMEKRQFKSALIVSDDFMVKSGLVDRIKDILISKNIVSYVYAGVLPNPTIDIVNETVAVARMHNVDCLVSVGGGSQIDTCKAAGIILTNGGVVEDYEGVDKSKVRTLPIIVVNTTAGTGSETTAFYVITNPSNHSKMCMVDTNCMVSISINDPELMVSMPPSLTVATGMDAMTHAIEAILSKMSTPLSDKDALWAISTINEYLPIAYKDGSNIKARTMMAYASSVAGTAFSNAGLGIVHSMAHALGGKYNLPHGLCNSLLLPYVMEFNGKHKETHNDFVKIAKALNIKGANWFPPARCVEESVKYIKKMCADLGVPKKLSELNLSSDGFLDLAQLAVKDTCTPTNPVSVTVDDIVKIYKNAY